MNKLITGALAGAVLMTAPLAASALVIDINTYVGDLAGSNVTVATLTLIQNGNSVDFKFENSIGNLGTIANNAFISRLWFSYDGSPLLNNNSSFWNFGGTQLVQAADSFGTNLGGAAGYDFYLGLDYPTRNNNPALRFKDGEYSTWTVRAADGVSPVLVSDFTTLVTANGKPASLAMVHIQELEGGGSLKYVGNEVVPPQQNQDPATVPEPATLALLGLGMASLALTRKRKK